MTVQSPAPPFLSGGGEMGARIRAYDWTSTPLGPPTGWPQELRSALSICLNSSFPTAIYWGPQLTLLYNDAWAPIPAEKHPWALGRPAREVWTDIWDVIAPQFSQVLQRAEGFSTFNEMLPMQRGGKVRETYWNYSLTPILDGAGHVAGIFNQGHEITEQVFAQREREEQIVRLREMFEQAPGAVALLRGPQHIFDVANAAYLELIGRDDVIGRPVASVLPEVVGQGFVTLLDQVYQTGERYLGSEVRVQLQRRNAPALEERVLDFIYQPIRSSAGDVTGIFVQATDTTKRSRAEASLRESEERFRLVADSAPVMLWMGDARGRCVYLNRAQREFWGVTAEVMPDFDWSSTLHPDDATALYAPFEKGMREHSGFTVEARYRRADGAYRLLATRALPRLSATGEFLGMIGVNVDITEARAAEQAQQSLNATLEQRVTQEVARRSQAEEALRQAQKMEAIGQLTGGIAHDFNNMLAVVIGGLTLLRRRLAQGETNVSTYIDGALEGANRAASLTQRLLAFARQQPLEPVPIDVNGMVRSMSELLNRSLGETVQVETQLAAGLWLVRADRNQLESALLNLAVNARDAMKNGGPLVIATANFVIDGPQSPGLALAEGEYVRINVTDKGSGMPPDVLARAFDPFFTTKAVGKGTGLGLSQVFGFVNQSGGHVQIDSEVGCGTTVSIFLPRFDGAVKATDIRPRVTAVTGSPDEIILVVEDEPRVRAFSAEALKELGYTVIAAGSGAEALKHIEGGERVNLLFTDVVMPDMTGWRLAELARHRLPLLKVVFTSGYARDAAGMSPAQHAAGSILSKPFSIDQLTVVIRDALDDDRA